MKSILKEIGPVSFPAFRAERVHMARFTQAAGVPPALARWQPTRVC